MIEKVISNRNTGSIYRALVIDNQDPEGLGKVKVRVPAIHGIPNQTPQYITDSDLPWATPACMMGIGIRSGFWIVPPTGSIVLVMFENGSIDDILYFGVVPYAENAYPIEGQPEGQNCKPTIPQPDKYKLIYVSRNGSALVEEISTGKLGFLSNKGVFTTFEDPE